jgi:Holliday junction resolvase RusA-like endonuclease
MNDQAALFPVAPLEPPTPAIARAAALLLPGDPPPIPGARSLCLRVFGDPQPWRRHESKLIKGWIKHYDDPKNVDWKRTIQGQIVDRKPEQLFDGAIVVMATFYGQRPKSLAKRVFHWLTRPDGGNLWKILEDSLTGIVWKDDSQVITHLVHKRYGETPGVEIEIVEVWR